VITRAMALASLLPAGAAAAGASGSEAAGTGHKIIPGGARAVGSEHEYGAAMEEERFVLLVVRLSIGDRFGDVSSADGDERLSQAGTVARHAEAWLADVRPAHP
jgi:hypothetical protein